MWLQSSATKDSLAFATEQKDGAWVLSPLSLYVVGGSVHVMKKVHGGISQSECVCVWYPHSQPSVTAASFSQKNRGVWCCTS